jgi:hypothetical protein
MQRENRLAVIFTRGIIGGYEGLWKGNVKQLELRRSPIKPRSEKGLFDVKIEQIARLWSSLRPYYDAPKATSNALLTPFYYDVTQTVADQQPCSLRLRYAAATKFKIILRRYADLDDCTTTSLRWYRSYYDYITLLVRFW